jgi:hypothetical protein
MPASFDPSSKTTRPTGSPPESSPGSPRSSGGTSRAREAEGERGQAQHHVGFDYLGPVPPRPAGEHGAVRPVDQQLEAGVAEPPGMTSSWSWTASSRPTARAPVTANHPGRRPSEPAMLCARAADSSATAAVAHPSRPSVERDPTPGGGARHLAGVAEEISAPHSGGRLHGDHDRARPTVATSKITTGRRVRSWVGPMVDEHPPHG